MTWCRTIVSRASFRACLIAAGLTLASSLGAPAATGAADEALLQATPLILKDGRIANVSIHVVAFAQGQSALGGADAQHLRVLTEDVATDCFLTAQVIGHVGSAEVAGSDTLNAHRLARSRADAVQASLIESGLPAKAIASVWDWQFMVREPRATLWVFRLTPGEDCEDAPLDGAAPALVAQADARELVAADMAEASERDPASETATGAPPVAPVPATVTARPAGPSPTPVPTVTQALPAASPSTGAPAAAAVGRPPVGTVVALPGRSELTAETPAAARPAQTAPAGAAPTAVKPAEARSAEARPAGAGPAEVKPAEDRPAEARPAEVMARAEPAPGRAAATAAKTAPNGRAERLAIVFPTNSSYFPPGANERLRSLLRELAQDRAYEIVLQSSVSGSQQVVGAETTEEAMRYNQWLAERRLERVLEWLDRNAAGRALTFRRDYRAGDESREVVLEVRPTG